MKHFSPHAYLFSPSRETILPFRSASMQVHISDLKKNNPPTLNMLDHIPH